MYLLALIWDPLQRHTISQVPQFTASILSFFDMVFFCLNFVDKFLSSTLFVELQIGFIGQILFWPKLQAMFNYSITVLHCKRFITKISRKRETRNFIKYTEKLFLLNQKKAQYQYHVLLKSYSIILLFVARDWR